MTKAEIRRKVRKIWDMDMLEKEFGGLDELPKFVKEMQKAVEETVELADDLQKEASNKTIKGVWYVKLLSSFCKSDKKGKDKK